MPGSLKVITRAFAPVGTAVTLLPPLLHVTVTTWGAGSGGGACDTPGTQLMLVVAGNVPVAVPDSPNEFMRPPLDVNTRSASGVP